MDKFRSISDVYMSGETYKKSNVPTYQQSNTLGQAYQVISEAANPNVLSPDALFQITGADSDLVINYYRFIRGNGSLTHVLSNATILLGSPENRAVNFSLKDKTYKELVEYIESVAAEKDEPFKITTSGKIKKLRTPNGGRICQWAPIEGFEQILQDPASNPVQTIRNVNFLRVMMFVHLCHTHGNNLEQVDKMPPGISYEIDQIDTFNEGLEGLPPLAFKLPGSNDVYRDSDNNPVFINGAENVEGVPKADMAFTKDDDHVFWISYKHGE